jgi:hypothetical protein
MDLNLNESECFGCGTIAFIKVKRALASPSARWPLSVLPMWVSRPCCDSATSEWPENRGDHSSFTGIFQSILRVSAQEDQHISKQDERNVTNTDSTDIARLIMIDPPNKKD